MTDRRSYQQFCGLARALDIVGERWTLLIVRNLLLGPLRYGDLLRGLPGITTNLLAKRLKEMETAGLVERVRRASGDRAFAYQLSSLGRELEPAIHALGSWGFRQAGRPGEGDRTDLEWLFVALRRRYLGGRPRLAELVADQVPYTFALQAASADITRGSAAGAGLRVRGAGAAIGALFLQGIPDRQPEDIEIVTGDWAELKQLVMAFRRHDKPGV
jgi:DNA-binding HxlR family transcriptional regulator